MKSKYIFLVIFTFIIIVTTSMQSVSGQIEYTYYYGLNPSDPQIIQHYGKLPSLQNTEQRQNWSTILEEVSKSMRNEFSVKYMYPYGEVVTCGSNSEGYFVVLILNRTTDKERLDEIYAYIENVGNSLNIYSIPVEFGYAYLSTPMDNLSEVNEVELKTISEAVVSGRDIDTKELPILAVYGEIPEWKNQEEFSEWYDNKLAAIIANTGNSVMQAGNVQTYGPMGPGPYYGSLEVGIYKGLAYEEKMELVTKIYPIIDEEARKMNISNVPVVFIEDEVIACDETTKSESSPGFSSIGLLTVIILYYAIKVIPN